MNATNPIWRHALCAAALALSGTSQAQSLASPSARFERAMTDYEHHDFAAAYQALWKLADQGHPEAARIALLMAAHGQRLYGQRFAIGAVQRERWLAAALPHAADKLAAVVR